MGYNDYSLTEDEMLAYINMSILPKNIADGFMETFIESHDRESKKWYE